MKILIVAGYFPPYCPASASRVNKLAKFLEDRGHDVHILCPKNEEFEAVLLPEISLERVHYTAFTQINDFPTSVKNFLKNLVGKGQAKSQEFSNKSNASDQNTRIGKESKISILYRNLFNIPDSLIGWYPHAVKEGGRLFKHWKPDIIFATLPPFTTMLVAHRLGRMMEVPVIYDYRDLWSDHPYYGARGLRRYIDIFLEKKALKNCAGLVTVTETWARHLRETCTVPVECIMNGFDPSDFSFDKQETFDKNKITLLYAGYLYGEKRDISVVLEALGMMGNLAQNFNILLYTPNGRADLSHHQNQLIAKYKLEDIVICNKYIPQKKLLRLQQQVDVLMLLRWDHPSENGVIAGKLFEYIGAGKPILSLGSTTGEASDIIKKMNFGLVSNDAGDVSRFLSDLWNARKKGDGKEILNQNRKYFTREVQFSKLVIFMEKVIFNYKK